MTETNDSLWPGPDLRPIPHTKPARYDCGMLPPRFFKHLRTAVPDAHWRLKLTTVPRLE